MAIKFSYFKYLGNYRLISGIVDNPSKSARFDEFSIAKTYEGMGQNSTKNRGLIRAGFARFRALIRALIDQNVR